MPIVIVALLLTSNFAWATGGRLDKDGCHNSKKAGYHCHRSQSTKASEKPTSAKGASGAASAASPAR